MVLDNNTVRKGAGRKARDTSHEKETSSIRDCTMFSNTQFFLHTYTTRHILYSLHHTVIPVFRACCTLQLVQTLALLLEIWRTVQMPYRHHDHPLHGSLSSTSLNDSFDCPTNTISRQECDSSSSTVSLGWASARIFLNRLAKVTPVFTCTTVHGIRLL